MIQHAVRQVEERSREEEMTDFSLVDFAVCEKVLLVRGCGSGESSSHL